VADALEDATGAVKQAITLSTGVIGLSLTFRKDIGGTDGDFSWLLETSWLLLGAAVIFGLWTLHKGAGMRQDGGKDPPVTTINIDDKDIRIPWLLSTVCFLLGVIAFVAFGFAEF
jgi:hypothetical protein